MPRDILADFSIQQALSVGSAADLAATDSSQTVGGVAPDQISSLSGDQHITVRVKNVGANALTTGVFIAAVHVSVDAGSNFFEKARVEVPAADLAAGLDALRDITFTVDVYDPNFPLLLSNVRVKMVYSTSGHTTASVVSLQVTSYFDAAGVGSYN